MPTSSGLVGGCTNADACAAETGLAPCPTLAVVSVTGGSEVAPRESIAPASALTVSAYVKVYGSTIVSNHKPTEIKKNTTKTEQKRTKENRPDRIRPDQSKKKEQINNNGKEIRKERNRGKI